MNGWSRSLAEQLTYCRERSVFRLAVRSASPKAFYDCFGKQHGHVLCWHCNGTWTTRRPVQGGVLVGRRWLAKLIFQSEAGERSTAHCIIKNRLTTRLPLAACAVRRRAYWQIHKVFLVWILLVYYGMRVYFSYLWPHIAHGKARVTLLCLRVTNPD